MKPSRTVRLARSKTNPLLIALLSLVGLCVLCAFCSLVVSALQTVGFLPSSTPTVVVIQKQIAPQPSQAETLAPTGLETEPPALEPSSTAASFPTNTLAATRTHVAPSTLRPTITLEPSATTFVLKATLAPSTGFDNNGDGNVTCADFSTQSQAKKALAAGYKSLDRDGDGIPCESLP